MIPDIVKNEYYMQIEKLGDAVELVDPIRGKRRVKN
jgi:hypothetical protein